LCLKTFGQMGELTDGHVNSYIPPKTNLVCGDIKTLLRTNRNIST